MPWRGSIPYIPSPLENSHAYKSQIGGSSLLFDYSCERCLFILRNKRFTDWYNIPNLYSCAFSDFSSCLRVVEITFKIITPNTSNYCVFVTFQWCIRRWRFFFHEIFLCSMIFVGVFFRAFFFHTFVFRSFFSRRLSDRLNSILTNISVAYLTVVMRTLEHSPSCTTIDGTIGMRRVIYFNDLHPCTQPSTPKHSVTTAS